MTRLEKAIKGLESCNNMQCSSCPYYDNGESFPAFPHCVPELRVDALELLKEKYKPRESRKMLPCKCGCNRREHWFLASYDNPEGLRCIKCGFTVWGKNATDAIRKWNEAVSQNDKA